MGLLLPGFVSRSMGWGERSYFKLFHSVELLPIIYITQSHQIPWSRIGPFAIGMYLTLHRVREPDYFSDMLDSPFGVQFPVCVCV